MESQHKKPYEIVIIGKKDVDCQTRTTKCGQDYNDDYFPPCKKKRTDSTGAMKDSIVIPCQKFFMCIPSTNHSQKPFIGGECESYKCMDHSSNSFTLAVVWLTMNCNLEVP